MMRGDEESSPYFSIIVASHNRSEYLGRLLKSIFSQSCQSFEVIVVDDCSEDRTLEVLYNFRHRYGKQLRFSHMSTHCGKAVADNVGIGIARGMYVVLVDSDDILIPGCLELAYSILAGAKDDLYYSGISGLVADFAYNNKISKQLSKEKRHARGTLGSYLRRKPLHEDTVILILRSEYEEKLFPEVDLVYPEGGFWTHFYEKSFIYLKSELIFKTQGTHNALTGSSQIYYPRGRAYSLRDYLVRTRPVGSEVTSLIRTLLRYAIYSNDLFSLIAPVLRRFPIKFIVAMVTVPPLVVFDRIRGLVIPTHSSFMKARSSLLVTHL